MATISEQASYSYTSSIDYCRNNFPWQGTRNILWGCVVRELQAMFEVKNKVLQLWVREETESFSIPLDSWIFVFCQHFQTEPGWSGQYYSQYQSQGGSSILTWNHATFFFSPCSNDLPSIHQYVCPAKYFVYSLVISPNAIPDAVAVARKLRLGCILLDGLCRFLLCCPVRRTQGWWCWEEPRERGTD